MALACSRPVEAYPHVRSSWLPIAIVLLSCAALGAAIYYYGHLPPPVETGATQTVSADGLVMNVLTTLKVITVEGKAEVEARRYYEDWRGTVTVEISVPVDFLYGVDLSKEQVEVDIQDDRYVRVVVPPPTCLYTRYDTSQIREKKVEVTGVHTRKGAGQTQLTLCIYEDLPRAIKESSVKPELMSDIRERSREQLRKFLQTLLPDKWVEVRFNDEVARPLPNKPLGDDAA